jgi:hypothetical protein
MLTASARRSPFGATLDPLPGNMSGEEMHRMNYAAAGEHFDPGEFVQVFQRAKI